MDGMSPLRTSSSIRSMRCMGKKTVWVLTGSSARIWWAKSSREISSIPRTLIPAPETDNSEPQNFSRGEFSVISTMLFGGKASIVGALYDRQDGCPDRVYPESRAALQKQ